MLIENSQIFFKLVLITQIICGSDEECCGNGCFYHAIFLDALASLKTMLDIHSLMFSRFQDCRVLESIAACYIVSQSVTECYRVLQSVQSVTECYRKLKSVTECYRVLQGVTEFYRVLQSVTECNRVL